MTTNCAALASKSPAIILIDMLFLYLMCTLAENSSNQGNTTVDISINPRDVTADWPRKGLRCTPPAISKMELQTKPADPNKCRLQLTKG